MSKKIIAAIQSRDNGKLNQKGDETGGETDVRTMKIGQWTGCKDKEEAGTSSRIFI